MKHRQIVAAAASVLLLIGWGLHKMGWFGPESEAALPRQPIHVNSTDSMDTPSGWRYRQNLPHHWRYIMLQKN